MRFADLLNTKGLALLCEKKRPLDMLLASGPSPPPPQPQSGPKAKITAEQQLRCSHKTKQKVDYDEFRFPRHAEQLFAKHTSFTSPVIVSWLDGVEGVWLQLQSRDAAEDKIGAMHDRLMQLESGGNKALRRLDVAEIREGALCCCIFFDMHVYRARVNFLELTARVFYVDFGNHENMAFDEYYINSHLIEENISDKFENDFFMYRSIFIVNFTKLITYRNFTYQLYFFLVDSLTNKQTL